MLQRIALIEGIFSNGNQTRRKLYYLKSASVIEKSVWYRCNFHSCHINFTHTRQSLNCRKIRSVQRAGKLNAVNSGKIFNLCQNRVTHSTGYVDCYVKVEITDALHQLIHI